MLYTGGNNIVFPAWLNWVQAPQILFWETATDFGFFLEVTKTMFQACAIEAALFVFVI